MSEQSTYSYEKRVVLSKIYLLVHLQLHISQGCSHPRTFFENIGLNLLSWNSLVSN